MPIHERYSNEEFISRLIDMANQIRAVDRNSPHDKEAQRRLRSDLSIAYSLDTHFYYFGYNGAAGEMTSLYNNIYHTSEDEITYLRISLLNKYIHNPVTNQNSNPIKRPKISCAEADALSKALVFGESLDRLFFVAFYPDTGDYARKTENSLPHIKPPCQNCTTWISGAYGYWKNGVTLSI